MREAWAFRACFRVCKVSKRRAREPESSHHSRGILAFPVMNILAIRYKMRRDETRRDDTMKLYNLFLSFFPSFLRA